MLKQSIKEQGSVLKSTVGTSNLKENTHIFIELKLKVIYAAVL